MDNELFFSVFEDKIRQRLIDFCHRINESDSDIYILMARKAACLITALEDLNLISLNGKVISEILLDTTFDWSDINTVTIIDDVIISGTTLNRTITKLLEIKDSIDVRVNVIGINDDWFNEDLLLNSNNISYLKPPFAKLENSQCIRLSGDIVRALSIIPQPYSIDFPTYSTVKLSQDQFNSLLNLPNFEINDVTSKLQYKNDVFTYTISPSRTYLKSIFSYIPSNLIDSSLCKIRIYGKKKQNKKEIYAFSLVPMVVLPPLLGDDIEEFFNQLAGKHIAVLQNHFKSILPKLRFIQFVLADRLAFKLRSEIDNISSKGIKIERKFNSLRLLFSEPIIPTVLKVVNDDSLELNITIKFFPGPKEFISKESSIIDSNYISLNNALIKPFCDLYYDCELKAREYAFEFGRKVFEKPEHSKVMNRLKMGYSLIDLEHILSDLPKEQIKRTLSVFLDRAIDNGIVVPTLVANENVYYRAFRHGEDVQFGEREEKLCFEMLKAFTKSVKRENLDRIWVEKLLVLFIKLGEKSFLEPIQSETRNYLGIHGESKNYENVASIKYYLQGPVVVKKRIRKGEKILCDPCLDISDRSSWLTKYFSLQEGFLSITEKGAYKVSDKMTKEIIIEKGLISESTKIGRIFGNLISNELEEVNPRISNDEFISLTCCSEPNDIIGALAAEINITVKIWDNRSAPIDQISFIPLKEKIDFSIKNGKDQIDVANQLRSSPLFQAIKSGKDKFTWFINKIPKDIIKRISKNWKDELYRDTWDGFWSPNLDWNIESEETNKLKLIFVEGIWMKCINIYMRMLEYCLRFSYEAEKKVFSEHTENIYIEIKNLYDELIIYKDHSKTKKIIPFVYKFLKTEQEEIEVQLLYGEIIKRINSLVFASTRFLEEINIFYENFKNFPEVKGYNNALYFSTEDLDLEEETMNQINLIFASLYFRYSKVKEDEELLFKQIKENECPFIRGNGFWFVGGGNDSIVWLNQLINELIKAFGNRINYKIYLFTNIPNSCLYRVANRIHIMAKNFWYYVSNFEELIGESTYMSNTVHLVRDNKLKGAHRIIPNSIIQQEQMVVVNIPFETEVSVKRHLINIKKERMKNKFNIGILTIVTEEMQAVLKYFNKDVEDDKVIDSRSFYETYQEIANSEVKIVILQSTSQGNIPIVNAYNSMIKHYKLDYIVLLGIAGSIKANVKLCDVVLGTQCLYYEKNKDDGNGSLNIRGEFFQTSPELTQIYNKFFVKHSEPAFFASRNDTNNSSFNVYRGPIGTGEAVIGNPNSPIKKWLQTVQSKTCAVETEAAGFCQAFYESGMYEDNTVKDILIIRGISDHADFDKDDKWRLAASNNAIQTLISLLNIIYNKESK